MNTCVCYTYGVSQFCVNIVDANDNCPMFSAPIINISVPEALGAGAVVDTVTAVDDDIGTNGEFNYRIAGGTGQGWDNTHMHTYKPTYYTHICRHARTRVHTHTYTQLVEIEIDHPSFKTISLDFPSGIVDKFALTCQSEIGLLLCTY